MTSGLVRAYTLFHCSDYSVLRQSTSSGLHLTDKEVTATSAKTPDKRSVRGAAITRHVCAISLSLIG